MVAQLRRITDPSPHTPTILHGGAYVSETSLARFGNRTLYAGHEPSLNREILIEKVIHPGNQALLSVAAGREILTKLCHVDLAQCIDAFAEDGALYAVMAAGIGRPLSQIERIDQHEAVIIGVHICNALNYLHHHQHFAHQGALLLDPSAIFVTEAHRARLITHAALLDAHNAKAPLQFAPPEGWLNGDATVFSLAATLHQALTGWNGWYSDGAPPAITRCPEIAPEFSDLLTRALSIDKERRWQGGIEAFRFALLRFE